MKKTDYPDPGHTADKSCVLVEGSALSFKMNGDVEYIKGKVPLVDGLGEYSEADGVITILETGVYIISVKAVVNVSSPFMLDDSFCSVGVTSLSGINYDAYVNYESKKDLLMYKPSFTKITLLQGGSKYRVYCNGYAKEAPALVATGTLDFCVKRSYRG